MSAAGLTYCGELVQRHDPDRFLMTLVMKPEVRPALWALFAFNHEIAKTREVVTETTLGLIRLQWWRDALAQIYEQDVVLQNEVLPELAAAIKAHDLPREAFEGLIYAREFDLENVAPGSLEGLENYADYTNAPLLRLALKITGQDEDEAAVRSAAVAYGLTGLLRAVPFHAGQGRSYLPADLAAGGNQKAAVQAVAECAKAHLGAVRPQGRLLKNSNRIAGFYLKQIKGLGYDVYNSHMAAGPPLFHLRFLLRNII